MDQARWITKRGLVSASRCVHYRTCALCSCGRRRGRPIDRCRKAKRRRVAPKRSPMHALRNVRLRGDQFRRSNRPSRPSQSVRARPTCLHTLTRFSAPAAHAAHAVDTVQRRGVSNCNSSLGRGGRRLGLVVVVFKLLIGEVFLQIDAGMFATEATALCKVPSVRIRRHTHRQEHRVPYTFIANQKTCQLDQRASSARVEGCGSE